MKLCGGDTNSQKERQAVRGLSEASQWEDTGNEACHRIACLSFVNYRFSSTQIPSSTLAQKFPIRYNKTKNIKIKIHNTKECNRHA